MLQVWPDTTGVSQHVILTSASSFSAAANAKGNVSLQRTNSDRDKRKVTLVCLV